MTQRDRALAALRGEEIFPVPCDVFESAIYPELLGRLCQHYGLVSGDTEGVLRKLGACMRRGTPLYTGPALEKAEVQTGSPWPHKATTRSIWGTYQGLESYSEAIVERPLRDAETVSDVEAHLWPDADWFDYERIGWYDDAPEEFLPVDVYYAQYSDCLRHIAGFDPIFGRIMDLCGFETGLLLIGHRPDLVHAMVAQIGEFLEAYYGRLAEACRGHVDLLGFGDDFADQRSMLISPDKWREFFLPTWKRLFDIAHENGLRAQMHMCGAVRPILGDLIDAGLDVFEVVQVTARGMEASELKREFGDHLAFYGGVDTQQALPLGSTDDVRREVRRMVRAMGRGGRYVMSSAHFLMNDVPIENVLAMYDEARTYTPDAG